jgi:hypothetical protein
MNTAHKIDMKELRYVCGAAMMDYAAIIAMDVFDDGDSERGVFGRLERLLAAASATDWLTTPYDDRSRMVEGLKSSPDRHEALIEVLDFWVTTCGGREEGESGGAAEHWRVEGDAAERVLAFARELLTGGLQVRVLPEESTKAPLRRGFLVLTTPSETGPGYYRGT